MTKYQLKLSGLFLLIVFVLSGCSINLGGQKNSGGNDGGFWRSKNNGTVWQQSSLVANTAAKVVSFGGLDANVIAIDPSDNKAIYFGTGTDGLFYTYDAGQSWQVASSLGKISISAVAVDPKNKCVIYAASANKIFKSIDCNRTWVAIYNDTDGAVTVNSLVIDTYSSTNIYVGTSRGEIINSADGGASWKTLNRFSEAVKKIILNTEDSRIMFVATANNGLWRSTNKGDKWFSLDENMKDFSDSKSIRDVATSLKAPKMLILATNNGLLKSVNNGDDWTRINLLTPEASSVINAVTINQDNPKIIAYTTNSTFYSSVDGGDKWTTKKLPTTRAGWLLVSDKTDFNALYMGTKLLKK